MVRLVVRAGIRLLLLPQSWLKAVRAADLRRQIIRAARPALVPPRVAWGMRFMPVAMVRQVPARARAGQVVAVRAVLAMAEVQAATRRVQGQSPVAVQALQKQRRRGQAVAAMSQVAAVAGGAQRMVLTGTVARARAVRCPSLMPPSRLSRPM